MCWTERSEGRSKMQCARARRPHRSRIRSSSFTIAGLAAVLISLAVGSPASAATLERVKQASKIILGYRADARPFAFRDESGNAAGYAVALCQKIAEQVKAELGLSTLAVEWSPVTVGDQFRAVRSGRNAVGAKGRRFLNSGLSGWNRSTSACRCSGRTAGGFVRSTILGADLARLARTSYRKTGFLGRRGYAERGMAGPPT